MKYPDGSVVREGDLFLTREGSMGHLLDIIESPDECRAWGQDAPGFVASYSFPLEPVCDALLFPLTAMSDLGIRPLSKTECDGLEAAFTTASQEARTGFQGRSYAVVARVEDGGVAEWQFSISESGKQ